MSPIWAATLLAYMAWKHATHGQDLEPIDGFTPEQRFFIGMAQWACGDERAENKRVTRHHRSAFAGRISHQRRGREYAGIRQASPASGQPMVRKPCRVW